MKNRIEASLARLASRTYQNRYVIGGTVNEYVLPEEMLDSACLLLENVLGSEVLSRSLTAKERDCLAGAAKDFRHRQTAIPFENPTVPIRDVIEHNKDWLAVRERAESCLKIMGFDLAHWESTCENNVGNS